MPPFSFFPACKKFGEKMNCAYGQYQRTTKKKDEWSNKRVAEKLVKAGVVVMPKKYRSENK